MLKRLIKGYSKKNEEEQLFQEFLEQKPVFSQFVEYLKLGTHLPALHIVKQNNIRKLQKEYGLTTFVETGTFMGDMVEAQRTCFNKIYSVELSKDLYHQAVERFAEFPHIKIIQGDSGVILKDLLKEINEPALFWLDGHYSAGITAKGDKNTPIEEELSAILNQKHDHIILIDDARLFIGEGDYPTIDEISSFVLGQDARRMVCVADDIIRVLVK
ncbi:hypothetical protein EDD80_111120 [Anseongella ginsenosidimutans]|uniref:Methyltransferase n=1 Tax=Anseongella ginsenosidimutans TaxID=496056 RepID=A0A4R3KNW2_9SPHI|nr:hypothetical protein [Anseongella ginsenosidimutans]QEC51986.1 hypothetical protein FRZ59_06340 [Anseongella ginsenosidimutans]TCS85717.1 hypothetical protein EDD80_111120 [Anseongella ginsenosidimutans]